MAERLLYWSLLLASANTAVALEPSTTLANYSRQSWAMENGLPQNTIQALAQTQDGFLWLGTEAGLVRFDGVEFQTYDHNSSPALPGNDIRALLATKDGALWIGTNAGLARWKDGAIHVYTTSDGLPGGAVSSVVETSGGTVWALTDQGLVRLQGDRVWPAPKGTPKGTITSLVAGDHDDLWVGTTDEAGFFTKDQWVGQRINCAGGPCLVGRGLGGSVNWANGDAVFDPILSGGAFVAQKRDLPQGSLQFMEPVGHQGVAVGTKSEISLIEFGGRTQKLTIGKDLPGTRIQTVLADRQGSLWIGTNAGLVRWTNGKIERFPVTDPLATASILAIMEDREGNLWIGTETSGLDILRDQRFRTLDTRDGLPTDRITTVVEDEAGLLWAGTQSDGVVALRRDESTPSGWRVTRTLSVENGMASNVVLSLAAARNGDLWVGTPDGLNRVHGGRVDTFTSADGLPDDFIRSLMADKDDSLWIGTRRGLTHWVNASGSPGSSPQPAPQMQTYTHANGLGSDLVGATARDTSGDLWIATLAGLSRLHNSAISNFTTANGLSSNVITALLPRSDGTLMIGTQDHGWNEWDGRELKAAAGSGLDQTTIRAILDDGRGHLWFATGNGIARCDCNAMGASGSGEMCSHWMEFGTADGLRSRETAANSHPSAWRARDGHLWFATPKGIVELDPAHFPVNNLPPEVSLIRFVIDDIAQPLLGEGSSLRVAAGHVHFEFDYAGLSFVAPQKVRYRYMLEGFDHNWTEAGPRRAAYYTNIPPGRYTFRVQAANNDGVWNTTGAALSFELRPHFYRTLWFYLLLAALTAAIIVAFLRGRLRRERREFQAVLGERSRIAREIHDTLAQGYAGVSVQLEVLAELLRQQRIDAAAGQLDKARDTVRHGLADARQSIWALRTEDPGETTLPVKLRRMAEAAEGHGLSAEFNLFGAYRALPPDTEKEIGRVAQEAIHNVKKHAGATRISVQLEYGTESIALEVRDNGRGGASERPVRGHFGLTGMKERAAAIGGTLEIMSAPGEGTAVRLSAPARGDAGRQRTER